MHETLFRAMGGVENIKKYYDQRYRLFSKFDEGVLLDEESWFSVRDGDGDDACYATLCVYSLQSVSSCLTVSIIIIITVNSCLFISCFPFLCYDMLSYTM